MDQDLRAIFYIDGLNLYYGIRKTAMPQLKWLDLQKLAENLLKPDHSLIKVKYFTADVTKNTSRLKQANYISALEALYPESSPTKSIKVIKGNFKSKKSTRCPECGKKLRCLECREKFGYQVEKETDVNIACEIMDDLCEEKFDVAYLISADGDLLEPIKRVGSKKTIVVVFPPNRPNEKIKKNITYFSKISKNMLESSMLPDKISIGKKTFERPPEWRKP